MRKLMLCLVLAGCATTGTEVKESGTRLTMRSSNSPSVAANCIARNVDNIGFFNLRGIAREIPGGYEVEVRAAISGRVVVYGEARPERNGSGITLWITTGNPEGVMANITKGC